MKTYKLIIPSAKTYLKRIVLIYGAQVRAGAHKHLIKIPVPGVAWRGRSPSAFHPQGQLRRPEDSDFCGGRDTVVNESPVGFQSRGALRKNEAETTGTNNRNLAV